MEYKVILFQIQAHGQKLGHSCLISLQGNIIFQGLKPSFMTTLAIYDSF